MRYKVRISELRYGEVEVEAENEEQAKSIAAGKEIEWVDAETTDMTAENMGRSGYHKEVLCEPLILEPEDWSPPEWAVLCKLCGLPTDQTERIRLNVDTIESFVSQQNEPSDGGRTYIVTEVCPHCESEVEMRWNTDTMGFKAFCPVCGQRLMLCDECRHTDEPSPCDYDSQKDGCHRNPPKPMQPKDQPVIRVDTPLGAIIARAANDPDYPGIWIDLRRSDADQDLQLALVEVASDEVDLPDGQPNLITRIWGNAMQDDYTDRVVHSHIEDYFRTEEDEHDGR